MEMQMQELKDAKEKAEKDIKLEISKGDKKIKLMEKQLRGQFDQVYG